MTFKTPRERLFGPPKLARPTFYPDGYVWVVDAINEIGRAFFEDEWTGEEASANDSLDPFNDSDEKIFEKLTGEATARAKARFSKASDWLRQAIYSNRLDIFILQAEMHKIPPNIVGGDKAWSAIARPRQSPDVSMKLAAGITVGPVLLKKETFHALLEKSHPCRKMTKGAETRCKNWLVGLMKSGPQKNNKDEYFNAAKDDFSISRRGFDRVWGEAMAETRNPHSWGKSGPKTKSS